MKSLTSSQIQVDRYYLITSSKHSYRRIARCVAICVGRSTGGDFFEFRTRSEEYFALRRSTISYEDISFKEVPYANTRLFKVLYEIK